MQEAVKYAVNVNKADKCKVCNAIRNVNKYLNQTLKMIFTFPQYFVKLIIMLHNEGLKEMPYIYIHMC